MKVSEIRSLFDAVRRGKLSPDEAVSRLRHLPFEDLGFAKVDHHRVLRTGMPVAFSFIAFDSLGAVLFLGGWRGPGAGQYPLLGVVYFMIKAFAGYFLVILMRSALPR